MRKKIAKKYLGSIVKERNILNEINYIGITRKFEDFKKEYEDEYTKIELVKENVILYKVDIKDASGSLGKLIEIRNKWNSKKYDYRYFYTKEQIKLFLENGLFVAIEGIGEINEEELNKLENSNLGIDWKYLDETNFYERMEFEENHNYNIGYDGIYVD